MNRIPIIGCGDREPHERHLVTTGFGQSMCPGSPWHPRPEDQTSRELDQFAVSRSRPKVCPHCGQPVDVASGV